MAGIKVIITGATGMVGEGVLFECLQNEMVSEVLIINRRHYDVQHPKLKELIVPDFFKLKNFALNIQDYNACFFCAGISSVGMKEDKYKYITYDTTLAFAKTLLMYNQNMVFTYVSGAKTDSKEKSRLMWARVKGKTENDLAKLGFKNEYNFRPGIMQPFDGQKNWKRTYKVIVKIIKFFSSKNVLTMHEVGKAMIHCATKGFNKNVLEISDIKALAHV
ncbi:MAG: NAD-dependent epimerase/dehydratase family protein [Parafilimonas sp.]